VVLAILSIVSILVADQVTAESDKFEIEGLVAPCGAVAVHAVAEASGKHIRFSDVVDMLGGAKRWNHSLHELDLALHALGLDSKVVNIPYGTLHNELESKRHFFILPIRESHAEANHCVAILDKKDDKLVIFDFPDLVHQWNYKRTEKVMVGPVIAIQRHADSGVVFQDPIKVSMMYQLTRKWWVRVTLGVSALICAILALRHLWRVKRKNRKPFDVTSPTFKRDELYGH
jgi:hypothetical protein